MRGTAAAACCVTFFFNDPLDGCRLHPWGGDRQGLSWQEVRNPYPPPFISANFSDHESKWENQILRKPCKQPMLTFVRRPHYISDWVDGFKAHIHILAPSTYIFFASGGLCPSFLFAPVVVDHVLECARDFLPAQLSALAPKIVKRQIRP